MAIYKNIYIYIYIHNLFSHWNVHIRLYVLNILMLQPSNIDKQNAHVAFPSLQTMTRATGHVFPLFLHPISSKFDGYEPVSRVEHFLTISERCFNPCVCQAKVRHRPAAKSVNTPLLLVACRLVLSSLLLHVVIVSISRAEARLWRANIHRHTYRSAGSTCI
jgi:hypothetical protein